MKKSILLSMFAALLLGFCSCSDDYVGDDKDYFSNPQELCQTWQLVGYGSDENFHMIDKDFRQESETWGYRFYLIFNEDGTFQGRDARNSLDGSYTCKNNKIKLYDIISTLVSDPYKESPAFTSRLHAAAKYGIKDGNKLRIYYSDKEYMYFVTRDIIETIVDENPSDPHIIQPGEKVGEVTGAKGKMLYNDILKLWCIFVYVEGPLRNIDSMKYYFPLNLDEAFQTNGMSVEFSGTVYQMDLSQLDHIEHWAAMDDYYMIDLKDIKEQEDENLTDAEKQLLHQTPEYEYGLEDYSRKRQAVYDAYTTETVNGWRITRDGQGYVIRVDFEDISLQRPPSTGHSFLVRFFGEEVAAKFVKVNDPHRTSAYEEYQLRCGDLTVSSYHFNYNEQGVMLYAYGEYCPIDDLNPNPDISNYLARMILASYFDASVSSIEENARLHFLLLPEDNHFVPRLIYNPKFKTGKGPSVGEWAAWIDAHTGRLICVYFDNI